LRKQSYFARFNFPLPERAHSAKATTSASGKKNGPYLPPSISINLILFYNLDPISSLECYLILMLGNKLMKSVDVFWHVPPRDKMKNTKIAGRVR
jgi:hypothetical protein